MKYQILAKSSSQPSPYTVTFVVENGTIRVTCTCRAGELGQLCKHKTGLIENNLKLLFNSDDAELLGKAHDLVADTSLLDVYQNFVARRKQIEFQQAELKKELSNIKHQFARQLDKGVPAAF